MTVKIGFAGMTHLGLVSALGAAEKGFQVVCFDPDTARISQLQKGQLFIVEPGLPESLVKNRARLQFTSNVADLKQCDLLYIACDVATNDRGESDLSGIGNLIRICSKNLNAQALLIILSQVPPGFTRKLDFDPKRLFYQVETLVFGLALERTLYPERFIVGAAFPEKQLPASLAHYLASYGCPIFPMCYESAELSKIAINMFLVSSVTTSNTIAELCETIGADWNEMIPTLQLDKRIGKHAYLSAGLGIAGGNLERDLTTFCSLSDQYGTDAGVVRAWQKNSQYRRNWALRMLRRHVELTPGATLGMLGLAYKKDTSSLKNSPALALVHDLKDFSLRVFDPAVKSIPDFPHVEMTETAEEVFEDAEVVIVMTPWDVFKSLPIATLAHRLKGKTVIDPHGILGEIACQSAGLNYYRIGKNYESSITSI